MINSSFCESCYFHYVLRDMSLSLHYCEAPSSSHLPISSCPDNCPFYVSSDSVYKLICKLVSKK